MGAGQNGITPLKAEEEEEEKEIQLSVQTFCLAANTLQYTKTYFVCQFT
jgi:hypothetical protein